MENQQISNSSYPQTPFEDIALALSGGGFRAAAYGLGTMMYLNKLQFGDKSLLERVKFMTSTSGGSIPTILYAISLSKGQSFDDFKSTILQFMRGDQLLHKALEELKSDKKWQNDLKSRNLINSFSKVYDDFLGGQTWQCIWDISEKTHLKEVCINATEFQTGQTFRFQNKEVNTNNVIGNNLVKLELKDDIVKSLRLGDILAASSCFPVGFEPMSFPDDFAKDEAHKNDLISIMKFGKGVKTDKFGLMDGGITDNQGVESMQLAFDRRNREKSKVTPFDLMIIADVSNRLSQGYDTEVSGWEIKSSLNFWHKTIKNTVWIFMPLVILSALAIYFDCFRTAGLVTIGPFILLTGLSCWYRNFYHRKSSKFLNWATKKTNLPKQLLESYLSYFTKLRIQTFSELLLSRLESAAAMSGEIFLKRVRRLNYENFFGDKTYGFRRVSSFIYAASSSNQADSTDIIYKAHENLQKIAENARNFSTTLWFTEKDQQEKILKDIIATAQFTLCISLLNYINSLKQEDELYAKVESKNEIEQLGLVLLEDYEKFGSTPFFLTDGILK